MDEHGMPNLITNVCFNLETELWLKPQYSLDLTNTLVPPPKVSLFPAALVTQ